MGLFIFEGNEASGKTTLINELMKWRPWFINCKRHTQKTWEANHRLPSVNPEFDPYPAKWDFDAAADYDWRFFLEVIGYDPQGFDKASFVFDRSFITNHVFNEALFQQNQTQQHIDTMHAYEHQLSKIPHAIFYCKRSVDESFDDDFAGTCKLDIEAHRLLQNSYDDYFANAPKSLNIVEIDNDKLSVQDALNKIISYVGS